MNATDAILNMSELVACTVYGFGLGIGDNVLATIGAVIFLLAVIAQGLYLMLKVRAAGRRKALRDEQYAKFRREVMQSQPSILAAYGQGAADMRLELCKELAYFAYGHQWEEVEPCPSSK